MATFEFNKKIGDIEKAELLPEDWYTLRLVKEPKNPVPNTKKKNGLSEAEGAGDNIVLNFRVQSDNPKYHGRPFTKWLGVPNNTDEETFSQFTGQRKSDEKLERIALWAAALAGKEIKALGASKKLSFNQGDECLVYICQESDTREGHEDDPPKNAIDFNSVPRPIG